MAHQEKHTLNGSASASSTMETAVTKSGGGADPEHAKEGEEIIKAAFHAHPLSGKAYFISTAMLFLSTLAVQDQLGYKLGLRTNKGDAFKLKRVLTSPEVYQGEYKMPIQSSNCVVIKGKDGKLFIRSPPQPLPEIVAQITAIGEPGALLVSMGHDTYADKWKELFPEAVVIGMRKDVPALNNRVKVDLVLEEADVFLSNFHVSRVIPQSDFLRYEECTLLIQMEQGGVVASLGCGVVNTPSSWWNPLHWSLIANGMSGFRLLRPYGIFWVKDHDGFRAAWADLAKTPGLQGLIFLHGEPLITPEVGKLMERAYLGQAFKLAAETPK